MNTLPMVKVAATALILGTTMVGCSMDGFAQRPSAASSSRAQQMAASAAAAATKAMAKKQALKAVTLAEVAVTNAPRDAGYRTLLGQAYLGAGRFQSAEQSFADALTLDPERERAALNLALAQVALGKREAALATLADYRDKLPATDYGLALALAGNTEEAVRVLEFATRAPDATAKTRQNLALAYAMAGKWANARVTAVQDLSPDEADARIAGWASFVKPAGSWDQVASLLGVKPAVDNGMPVALALATTSTTQMASQSAISVPSDSPTEAMPAATDAAPAADAPAFETTTQPRSDGAIAVPTAEAAPAPRPAVEMAPVAVAVAPSQPAVAPVETAPTIKADPRPLKQAAAAPRMAAMRPAVATRVASGGKFVVQLGAFASATGAERAWTRATGQLDLAAYSPINGSFRRANANLVRLAVGGLATRSDADQLCARIRNMGSPCFVRLQSGDTPARWAQKKSPVRVATR